MPQASTCCQWQTLLSLTKRPGYFEQFLRSLVEKMEHDPSGPGVPPIAVLCNDVDETEGFSERLKDVYKYEVLGGQHTSIARAQLNKKYPRESTVSLNPGWSVRWAVWWWSSSPSLPTQCEWALCTQDDPPWLCMSVIQIIQSCDVASYFSGPLGEIISPPKF